MSNNPSLILASTSRYRKIVLEKLCIPFQTARPETDETPLANESAYELVKRLSELKARAVMQDHPNSLIIGSDQVAVLHQKILGKPGNHANAQKQLRSLSGNTVTFYTGLCLINSASKKSQVDVIDYQVTFRELNDSDINHYLLKDKPYDSAGSFKSEGLGITLFESINGDDPNALVGLPLISLTSMLKKEGFKIL